MLREVSQDLWRDELDSFSRQHEGWIVSIKTRTADGEIAVEARDLPLQGVSLASPRSRDVAITVGDRRGHLTHEVRDPAAVKLDVTADQAERALIIEAGDGTMTIVEFRTPMRPEEVDGLPTRNDE